MYNLKQFWSKNVKIKSNEEYYTGIFNGYISDEDNDEETGPIIILENDGLMEFLLSEIQSIELI